MAKQIKPTEGELEILHVLWGKRSATVREVHEELQKTKGSGEPEPCSNAQTRKTIV